MNELFFNFNNNIEYESKYNFFDKITKMNYRIDIRFNNNINSPTMDISCVSIDFDGNEESIIIPDDFSAIVCVTCCDLQEFKGYAEGSLLGCKKDGYFLIDGCLPTKEDVELFELSVLPFLRKAIKLNWLMKL